LAASTKPQPHSTEEIKMNWVYIHILINHVPVILGGLAAASAIFALIFGRRMAWLYTAVTLTLAGLSAYPTSMTGEQASRIFRRRVPSARQAIHDHQQAADVTLWILLGSGVLGVIGWYRIGSDDPQAPVPGWVKVALTVPALASLGAVAVTSELGGKIAHQPWETSFTAPPLLATDSTISVKPPIAAPVDTGVKK
jgi:hypothetical protein